MKILWARFRRQLWLLPPSRWAERWQCLDAHNQHGRIVLIGLTKSTAVRPLSGAVIEFYRDTTVTKP